VSRLVERGARPGAAPLVEFMGEVPERDDMLALATGADVGLAFMPAVSDDLNMRHMVGASNKAFDYLAAGQALLVSDLPDWRRTFAEPGYGRACDPADPDALTEALRWFADHPAERRAMGRRGRARIEQDWNYDTAFSPVLERLSQ
jgi:glycosyltransferase involved in cell wall biosynthesis